MTVKTSTSFDLEAFGRGYEEWDIDALLALYADEVELIQIDRDNPPRTDRTGGRECRRHRKKPLPSMRRSRGTKVTSSTSKMAGRWVSRPTPRTPTYPLS